MMTSDSLCRRRNTKGARCISRADRCHGARQKIGRKLQVEESRIRQVHRIVGEWEVSKN